MARREENKLTVLHKELLKMSINHVKQDSVEYIDNLELIIASSVNPEIALAMICGIYKQPEIKDGFKDDRYHSVEVIGFDKLRNQVIVNCIFAKRIGLKIPKSNNNQEMVNRIPIEDRYKVSNMSDEELLDYYQNLFQEIFDSTDLVEYDAYCHLPANKSTHRDTIYLEYWNEHCK
jgi:hypothetical protein